MKILSLYNGMSCAMLAAERVGFKVDRFVSFEIDKHANFITKKNYPFAEMYEDVFEGDYTKFKGFDILMGGSPCTHWSIANKNRETTSSGVGFELFMQYVRALKESEPKYFLYENNKSISKEIQKEITKMLGVEPIMIDSKLVSAQQRQRLYWTNIPNVEQPEDKGIYLKDILGLETEEPLLNKIVMTKQDTPVKVRKNYIDSKELSLFLKYHKEKSGKTLKMIASDCNEKLTKVEHWFRIDKSFAIPSENVWFDLKKSINITTDLYDKAITEFEIKKSNFDMSKRIYHINGKHPTLTTLSGGGQRKNITDGKDLFYLNPIHCERLQTVPDNFTEGVSDRQRFKMLGNGWTVDVIAHILSFIKEEK